METDSPRLWVSGTAWKWGTVRIEVKYTFPLGKNGNENDELGTHSCPGRGRGEGAIVKILLLQEIGNTKIANWERVLVRVFFLCVCVFGVFLRFVSGFCVLLVFLVLEGSGSGF